MENVLTAQSNQNVIYQCPECGFKQVNIKTSKGLHFFKNPFGIFMHWNELFSYIC